VSVASGAQTGAKTLVEQTQARQGEHLLGFSREEEAEGRVFLSWQGSEPGRLI
jgi:hypothetical protein